MYRLQIPRIYSAPMVSLKISSLAVAAASLLFAATGVTATELFKAAAKSEGDVGTSEYLGPRALFERDSRCQAVYVFSASRVSALFSPEEPHSLVYVGARRSTPILTSSSC